MTEARRLRALIVEDSRDDEALLILELRRGGYEVVHERVDTESAMKEALERAAWDVVLSDYAIPQFSAPDALALLRGMGFDTPFIIVSGTVGEEAAVTAMKSGANDYVPKGSLARLCLAIERELREAALRVEQKKMREQLLISDRMASIGTLAAGVAHEINNPLAAVIANLELIAKDLERIVDELKIGERMQEVLEELHDARESADRLRHIVRDLKIFSRASDEERPGAVDVQKILESTLRIAHNEIRYRARVERNYSAVPPVHATEARLGQVFLNLIVNAAQAIPEGQAEHNVIYITTGLEASGRVAVEVRDTGCGIPAENLSRIFDPFFTTKPVGVGTGLGLSICHQIVSGFGGDIQVDSQTGKGTAFRVLLPPARAEEAVKRPVVSVVPAARRGHVLVVDDEPMIGKAVGRMLGNEHEVTLALNAADALRRMVAGERFDVVLCDLMMPHMTGMELHAELLRIAPDQAARMVFLTGGAFTLAARTFLDTVPNQRLDKPFDTQKLRALINDQIKP
ncbi:MAG: response regulator [Nevskiales bacterium]|nr:response regulator [Nevskiales bacterium]